jgi:hypothetical protein
VHHRFFVAALLIVAGVARAADSTGWKSLFDGTSLAGWKDSEFDGGGKVHVENSFRDSGPAIVLETGAYLTGITWADASKLPRSNYEISLEAMKIEGGDFFCGLTFPVKNTACTLVVGGWGGTVIGLSNVDDLDASENDTTQGGKFVHNRWYKIRVRVTDERIQAWIDNQHLVELELKGRRIGLRFGDIDKSLPLGIAAYQTKAALRDIKLRRL